MVLSNLLYFFTVSYLTLNSILKTKPAVDDFQKKIYSFYMVKNYFKQITAVGVFLLGGAFVFVLDSKEKPAENRLAAGAENKAENKKELIILALGDSLTEGYNTAKTDAYPHQLSLKLNRDFPDVKTTVINAGISGSTSAGALTRLKTQVKKQKPNVLLLALGANDGLRGLSLNSLEQNLQGAVSFALKEKIKVVLAGMKVPPNYGEKYSTDFENVFNKLAQRNNLTFIPFLLKDVGTVPHLNLPDGIHPNPKGYQIITRNIAPYFKKFYK